MVGRIDALHAGVVVAALIDAGCMIVRLLGVVGLSAWQDDGPIRIAQAARERNVGNSRSTM
jgi:hypothetical protein